jgi:hypothetical protein
VGFRIAQNEKEYRCHMTHDLYSLAVLFTLSYR